jgi:hypothetical protein
LRFLGIVSLNSLNLDLQGSFRHVEFDWVLTKILFWRVKSLSIKKRNHEISTRQGQDFVANNLSIKENRNEPGSMEMHVI